MTKSRLIFYLIFAVFHLCAFVFTLTLPDKEQYQAMFKYLNWIPFFKYATLLGLILFCVDLAWSFKANREARREKDALAHELNMLKARLYDIQEGKESASLKQNPPKV